MLRRLRNTFFVSCVAIGAVAFGASACAGKKNTELVVSVTTDLRVPKDLNAVTVRVISSGAVRMENTYEVGPSGLHLPATIGIVPNDDGNLTPIDVELIGGFSATKIDIQPGEERVLRKVRLTFAKGRVGLVKLPLRFACYEKTDCDKTSETCVAGQCVPTPVIEGATLPEYTADQVFGAGGSDDKIGACWDPVTCLATAHRVAATSDPCVFQASGASSGGDDAGTGPMADASAPDASLPPGDGGAGGFDGGAPFKFKSNGGTQGLTVVLASPGNAGPGFCSGGECRVPLDEDANEGWEWTDETHTSIRLAQGICQKVQSGTLFVEAVDTCATKTDELPYCDATQGSTNNPDASIADGGFTDAPKDPCPAYATMCPGEGGSELSACEAKVSDPKCGPICMDAFNCRIMYSVCSVTDACIGQENGCSMCLGSSATDGGTSVDAAGPPDASASNPCLAQPSIGTGPAATLIDAYIFDPSNVLADSVPGMPPLSSSAGTPASTGTAMSCPQYAINLGGLILHGSTPKLGTPSGTVGVTAWIDAGVAPSANAVLMYGRSPTGGTAFSLHVDSTGKNLVFDATLSTGGTVTASMPMPAGSWHQVGGGYTNQSGGYVAMVLDGAFVGTTATGTTASLSAVSQIAIGGTPMMTNFWSGRVGAIAVRSGG